MNYQECTVEELAYYFTTKSTQAITQQLRYYELKCNIDVVYKIKVARALAKFNKEVANAVQ